MCPAAFGRFGGDCICFCWQTPHEALGAARCTRDYLVLNAVVIADAVFAPLQGGDLWRLLSRDKERSVFNWYKRCAQRSA